MPVTNEQWIRSRFRLTVSSEAPPIAEIGFTLEAELAASEQRPRENEVAEDPGDLPICICYGLGVLHPSTGTGIR